MKTILLTLLSVLATATAANVEATTSNCKFRYANHSYRRTSVLTIKGLPTNLAYNPNNKDLFFTLIDLDSLQNDEIQTKMEQYVLTDNEPIKIDNVKGQAAVVDVKNNRVFVATDSGLTVLNATYKAKFFSLKDEDIVQLFKHNDRDELYAVLYPNNDLYVIDTTNNEKRKIENIPCSYILAVDRSENIYFQCDSKYIKVLLKGFQEPIEFVGLGKNAARAIAVDSDNRVILATNNGLYHLRPESMVPRKLMDLDYMPSGITFDGNDFYIGAIGVIYKYSRSDC